MGLYLERCCHVVSSLQRLNCVVHVLNKVGIPARIAIVNMVSFM